MLKFNELRIDSEKNLIIDVSILDTIYDPEQTVVLTGVYVGVGTNILVNPHNYLNDEIVCDRVDYTHRHEYKHVFTLSALRDDISVGDIVSYSTYDFTVTEVKTINHVTQISCIYVEDTALTIPSTGNLTKDDGSVTLIPYTAHQQFRIIDESYIRGVRIVIPTSTIGDNADRKLLYVRVDADASSIEPTLPCNLIQAYTTIDGYVYDRCLLTNKVFDMLKSTDNVCDHLNDYANYIVQVKGLELAVESGNFNLANTYWNKFFGNTGSTGSITFNTGCGCRH